ncbi:hypothetical protein ACVWYH_005024 [Bradyrhizobium sp. GM24.11]
MNRAQQVSNSYLVSIAQAQDQVKTAQQSAHQSALAWQADMLGTSEAAKQLAAASVQAAEAFESAARAAHDAQFTDPGGSFGDFTPKAGQQYTSGVDLLGPLMRAELNMTPGQRANRALQGGQGISGAINATQAESSFGAGLVINGGNAG